jgi:ATP-dependent protease ClpP protease subunit
MPRIIGDVVNYKIDIAGDRSFYVSGEVDEVMHKHVYTYLQLYGNKEPINMILNSGGGELETGWAIYDLIQAHEGEVNIIVSGNASSAASVILQAGYMRCITKHSYVMIHIGTTEVSSGMTIANRKAWYRLMNIYTNRMVELYAGLLKITPTQSKRLIKVDQIYLGEEAVKAGLCDIVI